ncbi:uncharacterized protein LOC123384672 [Felis catus]|uniref:uncharacterized protein LOC123384672 n=1 Tax=Felis catus TaxID=9685 RepID=UPI001D19FC99|nr:uncharacterized protein LOC123384672 [Felis catus]
MEFENPNPAPTCPATPARGIQGPQRAAQAMTPQEHFQDRRDRGSAPEGTPQKPLWGLLKWPKLTVFLHPRHGITEGSRAQISGDQHVGKPHPGSSPHGLLLQEATPYSPWATPLPRLRPCCTLLRRPLWPWEPDGAEKGVQGRADCCLVSATRRAGISRGTLGGFGPLTGGGFWDALGPRQLRAGVARTATGLLQDEAAAAGPLDARHRCRLTYGSRVSRLWPGSGSSAWKPCADARWEPPGGACQGRARVRARAGPETGLLQEAGSQVGPPGPRPPHPIQPSCLSSPHWTLCAL